MASRVLLVLVVVLLWRQVEPLEGIVPPTGTSQTFLADFACALSSSNSQLSVFALSKPFSDGSDAWRTFSFTQRPGTGDWTGGPTLSPSSRSNGEPIPGTNPCILDVNSGNLIIGEPWANQGTGRVTWAKQSSDGFSSPVVVDVGKSPFDGFGRDVAVYNEWFVASAPLAEVPYIRFYRWQSPKFELHSEVTLSSLAETNGRDSLSDILFGAWIDIRNNWAAIGAPANHGIGKVYMLKYSLSESRWALFQTVEPEHDEQEGHRTTFGTVVAMRGNRLFVSAPGSSTSHGSVFVYKFGLHDEWEVEKVLNSPNPERADEFGRAISATETTLAVSQAATSKTPSSLVHVYRQCGEYSLALHEVVTPDEPQKFVHNWGHRVAWNLDTLAIATPGLVNLWKLPPNGQCNTQVGAFPAPSCCHAGANVIVDPSGTVAVRGADSSVVSFTEAPVIISGNLEIDSSSVVSLKQGVYVEVEGTANFAGKLKYELPRPTHDGPQSIPIDNVIRFRTRRGSFSEVEVTFEAEQTACDRFYVQPVYSSTSLSLVVSVHVTSNCKASSNPLIPVYVTLGLLAFVILSIIFALWKFPQLREMISRPARHDPGYRHVRLADTDEDERPTNQFERFPSEDPDLADDQHSLGAETDSEDENDEDLI